jgi:hypothetical protein
MALALVTGVSGGFFCEDYALVASVELLQPLSGSYALQESVCR